jgi:hypothetical protein
MNNSSSSLIAGPAPIILPPLLTQGPA